MGSNARFPLFAILSLLALRLYSGGEGLRDKNITWKDDRQVWILSIGIGEYKNGFRNTSSAFDAQLYADYFKRNYRIQDSTVILLINENTTTSNIIQSLKEIASKAKPQDYFVFAYAGRTYQLEKDSTNSKTYFIPYDGKLGRESSYLESFLSLKILAELFQQIPCVNQLIISEASISSKFKTEFISNLMSNSIEIAGILNKNRVIIVPIEVGREIIVNGQSQGILNYCITTFPDTLEVSLLDLFSIEKDFLGKPIENKKKVVAYYLEGKQYNLPGSFLKKKYFEVFFERDYLKELSVINGSGNYRGGLTLHEDSKELKEAAGFTGNRYALMVGTDQYKSPSWNKLNYAVKDAKAVGEKLKQDYGFDVKYLLDAPMDSIYAAILRYYKKLEPNDQLILYFSGHGDLDANFLDDGFIVCTDSKSGNDDPLRNSYIPYTKLRLMLNKMPSKQVLLMLDVCHAGTFDDRIIGANTKGPAGLDHLNMNVKEFLKDKGQHTTRWGLTSVGNEFAFDGNAWLGHSPFANLLLQVLEAKGQGTNGIVTLSDIYAVLQSASNNSDQRLKISPHRVGFGDNNPLSEFILIPEYKEQTIAGSEKKPKQ